jgi:tetratricopeptide (TPR) repeat protein
MDTGKSLERAAHRRLWGLLREVSGDDLRLGQRLLENLRDEGAIGLDSGAFAEFDRSRARLCLRAFLDKAERERLLGSVRVPASGLSDLTIWEVADVPFPLANRLVYPNWLAALVDQGLVRSTPRGLVLSPRLVLYLWLHDGEPTKRRRASLVWPALRALRRLGRWHEAARLAQIAMDSWPGALERHPSLGLTVSLGYAQSQNYAWLHEFLRETEGKGWQRRLEKTPWRSRLGAIREFVAIERGESRGAPRQGTPEGRLWYALARSWQDIYAGRYRRAQRLLDFVARSRPPRLAWLDSVLLAWRASALHYLERHREARDCYMAALKSATACGWKERELVLLRNLALSQFENGETEVALAMLQGLLFRHQLEGRLRLLPGLMSLQALILNTRVRLGAGAWTNRRALALGRETEAWHQVLYLLEGQAVRARRSGLDGLAEQLCQEVAVLAERIGHPLALGHALWQRARMAWRAGRRDAAFELLDRADSVFAGMSQLTRQADMSCDRALFQLELGDLPAAKAQIEKAARQYGTESFVREASILPLLRLEVVIRENPHSLREVDLDLIRYDREDTRTRTAYAHALVALGFAILDAELSARDYGRVTLDQMNRLLDPFLTAHVLELGQSLRKHSRICAELVSYWSETFPFRMDRGLGTAYDHSPSKS